MVRQSYGLTVIYYCFMIVSSCLATETTLKQLHVVFRHGDRNPDILYPKDPNINDTWLPDGYGQLTMRGKMREYNVGRALRQRYDSFLGKIYTPDLLDSVSTDKNRTKMSLQLVLAGLFPPVSSQIWNPLLPWQPIPYNYVSVIEDPLMRWSTRYCPNYITLYDEAENSGIFKQFWESNINLINYISKNSGIDVKTYFDLLLIYDALLTETETGRRIPQWTDKIFPEFLSQAVNLYYELGTYTDEMNKLAGGGLLKKIISDMLAKKDEKLSLTNRKIFLYSGHEYNVAYILGALKVFKPHMPPYGSYVVLELHKINNTFGVKILYQNYSKGLPQYLPIPGCDIFYPMDQFVSLTQSVMPDDSDNDICYT